MFPVLNLLFNEEIAETEGKIAEYQRLNAESIARNRAAQVCGPRTDHTWRKGQQLAVQCLSAAVYARFASGVVCGCRPVNRALQMRVRLSLPLAVLLQRLLLQQHRPHITRAWHLRWQAPLSFPCHEINSQNCLMAPSR